MNHDRASELVGHFKKRIVVVGDVILDHFVWGDVNRFSPEAPTCPIHEFSEETRIVGGAGNVAANLNALGSSVVYLYGLIGWDPGGTHLKNLLRESDITDELVVARRPTTVKTRFVAHDQHLLRHDREETSPAAIRETNIILSSIRNLLGFGGGVDAIIVQDYAKGVITEHFLSALMDLSRGTQTPVFIDPKSEHWSLFSGAELVKPNLVEAMSAFGVSGEKHEGNVELWGSSMLHYSGAKAVIVTRGSDGMSLFSQGESIWVNPEPVDVVDVSGAGDTTMATLTLSRLAGASWREAMELANAAAGLVVGKRGTSIVTAEELLGCFPKEEEDA